MCISCRFRLKHTPPQLGIKARVLAVRKSLEDLILIPTLLDSIITGKTSSAHCGL